MQVSFTPVNNIYSHQTFGGASKDYINHSKEVEKDKIITAKTKKIASECAVLTLAASILYFAVKRNIKMNAVVDAVKKSKGKASETITKNPDAFDPSSYIDPSNVCIPLLKEFIY
ncbi:hypothetical protein IJD44_08965 [bacterium]|nr:hypothetical protein [bacterium]